MKSISSKPLGAPSFAPRLRLRQDWPFCPARRLKPHPRPRSKTEHQTWPRQFLRPRLGLKAGQLIDYAASLQTDSLFNHRPEHLREV